MTIISVRSFEETQTQVTGCQWIFRLGQKYRVNSTMWIKPWRHS